MAQLRASFIVRNFISITTRHDLKLQRNANILFSSFRNCYCLHWKAGYQGIKRIAVNGHPVVIIGVTAAITAVPSLPCKLHAKMH